MEVFHLYKLNRFAILESNSVLSSKNFYLDSAFCKLSVAWTTNNSNYVRQLEFEIRRVDCMIIFNLVLVKLSTSRTWFLKIEWLNFSWEKYSLCFTFRISYFLFIDRATAEGYVFLLRSLSIFLSQVQLKSVSPK